MRDQQMVDQILARDRRMLSTFYRTYTPRLLRFIRTKVGSVADAEEILQDTLFAFLEALRDFRGKSSLETFLFSICQHKIIDFYRRRKIKHIVFSRMPQLEELISPMLNPEEELDGQLIKEKTREVLAGLLPRYRHILTLKYLEGWSVNEIAAKFAVSFKSAESQLFRARKAFVELFLSI